jgi:hypothetical protein
LGDLSGKDKILNSVLISYSLQEASNHTVNSFQTKTHVGENSVHILLQHVTVAKGPKEVKIRRHLHPGEKPTAVMGSARCVFWNISLG